MKRFLLALLIGFGTLSALEEEKPDVESIWNVNGVYAKYGMGAIIVPILPTLGFGYYAKVGKGAIDFSVMDSSIFYINVIDIKLLALPVVKEDFQIGIGPAFLIIPKQMMQYSTVGSLGPALLFRKVNPLKRSFFQIELNIPVLHFGRRSNSLRHYPGIALMWGNRF